MGNYFRAGERNEQIAGDGGFVQVEPRSNLKSEPHNINKHFGDHLDPVLLEDHPTVDDPSETVMFKQALFNALKRQRTPLREYDRPEEEDADLFLAEQLEIEKKQKKEQAFVNCEKALSYAIACANEARFP